MVKRYAPISGKCPHFLHGGDYNPEQWLQAPEIWEDDLRLMKEAGCNAMAVGIFAWTALEPAEGQFTFGWLDDIMERLAANGVFAVLATPSGARPAWLSQKYPEVLRVRPDGIRNLHGARENHCPTSPRYREKCRIINDKLAQRYGKHPALLLWHVSNEYGTLSIHGGECYCGLCAAAFRQWLRRRYGDSLDRLNQAWWTAFWSHTFTDWEQIEPPVERGERYVHCLNLDWKRFVTDQTIDFYKAEIGPLRQWTPEVPITTNFMGVYRDLNYAKFAAAVDVVSWDCYPWWHSEQEDWRTAAQTGFVHDLNRCFKDGRPFMMMESTPSTVNWMQVNKPKRPGMHRLSALQAVAHGSDTVQYFQRRKSRGSFEMLHGAVVDHCGHSNTRVFRDVAEVGRILAKLDPVIGTTVRPEVAIIYDWEIDWAIEEAAGLRRPRGYLETCVAHYRPFWTRGVPVDVVSMDADLGRYRLVVAPMLMMLRPGVAERIEGFVAAGGTLVATYWTGIVDENDLAFLGGFPGPLRKVLGIWSEEIDALWDRDVNYVEFPVGNELGLTGRYEARGLCDLIHAETARVVARYGADFYAGRPALTVNQFGKGQAWYVASRNEDRFLDDFTGKLAAGLGLKRVIEGELPLGVTAQVRTDGEREYVFLLNFAPEPQEVGLGGVTLRDMLTGEAVAGRVQMAGYGSMVLVRQ